MTTHAAGRSAVSPACAVILCWTSVFSGGCGARDEGLHRVTGRVTHRGVDLPAGMVYFEPDSTRGNKGPTGYAPITSGSYDTHAGGRGVIGGAHIVRVEGYEPPPKNVEDGGKILVRDYRTPVDLPKSATVIDFDIPPNAAARR